MRISRVYCCVAHRPFVRRQRLQRSKALHHHFNLRPQEDILTLLDDEFGREYELDVPWNAVLAESYLYR